MVFCELPLTFPVAYGLLEGLSMAGYSQVLVIFFLALSMSFFLISSCCLVNLSMKAAYFRPSPFLGSNDFRRGFVQSFGFFLKPEALVLLEYGNDGTKRFCLMGALCFGRSSTTCWGISLRIFWSIFFLSSFSNAGGTSCLVERCFRRGENVWRRPLCGDSGSGIGEVGGFPPARLLKIFLLLALKDSAIAVLSSLYVSSIFWTSSLIGEDRP